MEDTLPADFHTGDSHSAAGSLAGEESHIADTPLVADNLPAESHIADNQVEEDSLPADSHQQVPAHKPAFPVQQRCR